jgi:serine phosphatase RsbU (regulator of sigma subunit)
MVALELEMKVKERTVEINQQKEEISAQRDLLQEQNVKLNRFHDHTTESLRYAQSIQAAILPSQRVFEQIAADYFVFIHPCEMVSGDFFWASTIGDYHIFCVADCTGHGVPGAFMSILGISTLNEIVNRHHIVDPAKILDLLRDRVIEALSQNDPENMHKDGLDIALCSFNIKTKELQFAGAGIPIWILSPSSNMIHETENPTVVRHKDFSLIEIKGDNMPVGKSPVLKPFTNRVFDLSKSASTSIYLSTDGFADQVSGDDGTKFGSQRLKNLIVSNADREMVNQKDNLSKTFTTWKGQAFQVDDVTVVGLKII